MKEIKLTLGYVAFVDDEDFEELSKYKWHCIGQKLATYTLLERRQKLTESKV